MKGIWGGVKKRLERLLNFLFSLTGIPWAIRAVSDALIRRGRFFAAAVCKTFLSLASITLIVWVTHDVWGSGEKLRMTVVALGILLAVMKYLVAIQEQYDLLRTAATQADNQL